MGTGQQGPAGPRGPPGPRGEPAVADLDAVVQSLSTQKQFLNSLAGIITSDTNLGSIRETVSSKIIQNPTVLSNTIAQNKVFQNLVGQNLINESTELGSTIADGIIADPSNTLQLASSIVSQGSFLTDLSKTLSDPNLPYADYIRGPPGSIANIKSAIQPISMLCDTAGNCKTPQFNSYLNFTSGSLLLNNIKGTPAFRVAGDGGPWVTGSSGGQLGTYNDNTNTGTVAIKWDAQGNVIVGDITQTTGSLKVGGSGYLNNLYAAGVVNANDAINLNSTDGSTLTQFSMHLGGQDSHSGGTGSTDGSTFTIIKHGPYRAIPGEGGKNAVLLNNYNNPIVFGDTTTSGNIFMLNNSQNIANLPNGNNWYTSITGMNTSGNNSAIINNTGRMGNLDGSLMLVGNASADKATGTRVVSVFDRLQIGDWQLYQDNNGGLQVKNVKNSALFQVKNDGSIDNNNSKINDATIRKDTFNNTTITTGNINGVKIDNGNLIFDQDKSITIHLNKDKTNPTIISGNTITLRNNTATAITQIEPGQTYAMNPSGNTSYFNGNGISTPGDIHCRDIWVNDSVQTRTGTIWLRGNTRITHEAWKWGDKILREH